MTQPNLFDQIQRGPNLFVEMNIFIAGLRTGLRARTKTWSDAELGAFCREMIPLWEEMDKATLTNDHERFKAVQRQIEDRVKDV